MLTSYSPYSHRKVLFAIAFASIVFIAGCGGSPVVAHPMGNFSNASFKGSYVFQMQGFILTSSAGTIAPYREVGVITADGNGHITAGTDAATTLGAAQNTASITGTYAISQDGTGSIVLNTSSLGALFSSQVNLALTLTGTSSAKLLEADAFADGTGTADLQDPTAINTPPSGTFVFRVHQDSTQSGASASQLGSFTVAGGNVTAGAMDENALPGGTSLVTLSGGSLTTPTGMGAGAGSFTSSSGTTDFTYYIVNSTKFALLISDAGVVGSGSAEAQSASASAGLSGTYAFGCQGDDLNGGLASVAMVGQFSASGSSISSAVLDLMQDGNPALQQTFTGAAGAPASISVPQGRVPILLSYGTTRVFWLVSSSRAFFMDEGGQTAATLDGTADLQTSSSFSAGTIKGQFALVMGGLDFSALQLSGQVQAVGRIATLQFDGSSKITLLELVNDSLSGSGAQNPGTLGGVYQVGGSGRITTQITSNSGGGPDLVLYAVSPTQAYALQIDAAENTSGTAVLQQQ